MAAADIKLLPVCQHFLSRAKYALKQQESNGTDRYKSFLQYAFKVCNHVDAGPVLAWSHVGKCKDYAKEFVTYNPATTLSTEIVIYKPRALNC